MGIRKVDKFTKMVLTIIAVCLMWQCAERTTFVPDADAHAQPATIRPNPLGTIHEVIRTRSLVIVDDDGKNRAYISAVSGEAALVLLDERERPIIWMTAARNGSATMSISDDKERLRVVLGVQTDGTPYINLADEQSNPRLYLDGSPSIALRDERHNRAILSVGKDGVVLGMMDHRGHKRAALAVLSDEVRFEMYDVSGKPRVDLAVETDNSPSLRLVGPSGTDGAHLEVANDGWTELTLSGAPDGKGEAIPFVTMFANRRLKSTDKFSMTGVAMHHRIFCTANLWVSSLGAAALSLDSPKGRDNVVLGVDEAGATQLRLRDDRGKIVWQAPVAQAKPAKP